jgi:hypothetical protein
MDTVENSTEWILRKRNKINEEDETRIDEENVSDIAASYNNTELYKYLVHELKIYPELAKTLRNRTIANSEVSNWNLSVSNKYGKSEGTNLNSATISIGPET